MRTALLAALLAIPVAAPVVAEPSRTQEYVPVEITFHAAREHPDPFNTVSVDVTFTDPAGLQWRVPAFWAGGKTWKVRYSSGTPGAHRYRSECNDASDTGLHHVAGRIEIGPYKGDNPLFKHGQLKVSADRRHLEHADGTPFFWLGDTWWMGLCKRIEFPDEFRKLAEDRVAKGFNVVQIVAGLYPDMHAFDPRGANEAGYPWEPEYAAVRPEYFDEADKRLRFLIDKGITPCIVGAWGYYMPWMGVEKLQKHWRYLIARYASWPVVWCAAGEANLPWYLAPGFPYDDREQVHGWTEVLRYIRRTDPFHRLLTIHPTAIRRYTSRHATDDQDLLDFDMLQTPHGQREAVPPTVGAARESYAASPTMPVINGEAAYEMLLDSIPAEWTRAMFWVCMMNGAAGHTYGANGIWQCNRPGQPHGASPTGGTYGTIPWSESMNLPGSKQIGLGKKLLEKFPWTTLQPHPEWASYAASADVSLDESRWIWYPEGNPAEDAPVAQRLLRATFDLPADTTVESARLRISADDRATTFLNGQALGSADNWPTGLVIDARTRLKPGRNVLAVLAGNMPAPVTKNPAGLIACLVVRFTDGQSVTVTSGKSWRAERAATDGWQAVDFDDSAWPAAMEIGRHGDPPWGPVGGRNPLEGPQSAGVPGKLRLVYTIRPDPIVLHHLEAGASYTARVFDPVTGDVTPIGDLEADAAGECPCAPPKGLDHDWLLILEPKGVSDPQSDRAEYATPLQSATTGTARVTLSSNKTTWRHD